MIRKKSPFLNYLFKLHDYGGMATGKEKRIRRNMNLNHLLGKNSGADFPKILKIVITDRPVVSSSMTRPIPW